MMTLTERIKAKALDMGYTQVGICRADDFEEYIETLSSREDTYDFYIADKRNPLVGARPTSVDARAKSVVVVAYGFSHVDYPKKLAQSVARAYMARAYNPPTDRINGARLQMLKDFLEENGCHVCPNITLPDRMAAARAGIATYGKNNFAYVEGAGSFNIITSIIVDAELDYDEPTMERPCLEGCTLCIDSCPTQAIVAPGVLDPRKCISFNCWYTQEGRAVNVTTHIPKDIREKMGPRIHGCDVCQEVCPRNQKVLAQSTLKDTYLELLATKFDLAKVLNMDEGYYEEVIKPIMYNYIQHIRYFRRNAAIAIGNSGDAGYLDALMTAATDEDELVREYAVWAIGKIGGEKAKTMLHRLAETEKNEAVKEEINEALSKIDQ